MARIGMAALTLGALALAAGCQAVDRQASTIATEIAPVEPNLRVTLAHGSCRRPPCPMGSVENLASGETTTVFDFDLDPLGLPDGERAALSRALFEDAYLVEGTIQPRSGYLGADGPVPVVVVTRVAGTESAGVRN